MCVRVKGLCPTRTHGDKISILAKARRSDVGTVQALYGGLWSEFALGLVRNAKRAPIYRWKRRGKPRRAEGDEREVRVGIRQEQAKGCTPHFNKKNPQLFGGRGLIKI